MTTIYIANITITGNKSKCIHLTDTHAFESWKDAEAWAHTYEHYNSTLCTVSVTITEMPFTPSYQMDARPA